MAESDCKARLARLTRAALLMGVLTTIAIAWAGPRVLGAMRSGGSSGILPFPNWTWASALVGYPTGWPSSSLPLPLTEKFIHPEYMYARLGVTAEPPRWAAEVRDLKRYASVTTEASGWPMLALAGEQWIEKATPTTSTTPTTPTSPTTPPTPLTVKPAYALFGFAGPLPEARTVQKYGMSITEPPPKPWMGLPLRPVWPGFVVDTAIFAAAWLPIMLIPMMRPRWWREGRRLRHGRCPSCGKDLAWDFAAGCEGCGWRKSG